MNIDTNYLFELVYKKLLKSTLLKLHAILHTTYIFDKKIRRFTSSFQHWASPTNQKPGDPRSTNTNNQWNTHGLHFKSSKNWETTNLIFRHLDTAEEENTYMSCPATPQQFERPRSAMPENWEAGSRTHFLSSYDWATGLHMLTQCAYMRSYIKQ